MKARLQQWVLGLGSALVVLAQVAAVHGQAATATAPAATAAATFSKEQLEQIVAPIALHPDPLISQILMASTYPLEIVEAGRWVKANPGLKDKALEEALKAQDWDPSVKSLCGFPDVLKQMDENLDWTQDLGDAFLAQKVELMDTIQRMRGKAYDAGNLKTTEQQVVTQQPDKIIVVQPADPEVIYVPTYSPTVVYGGWSYPTYYYPPMYYPPPYGYGAMAFTVGRDVGRGDLGRLQLGLGRQRRRHRHQPPEQLQPQHEHRRRPEPGQQPGRRQAVLAARCLAPGRRQLPRQQDGAAVRREVRDQSRLARPGARL